MLKEYLISDIRVNPVRMILRSLTPIIFFSSILTFLHLVLPPSPPSSVSTPNILLSQPIINSSSLSSDLPSLFPKQNLGSSSALPKTTARTSLASPNEEDRFGILMRSRLSRIANECKKMRAMGDLRDSWLLPENFITSTKWALEQFVNLWKKQLSLCSVVWMGNIEDDINVVKMGHGVWVDGLAAECCVVLDNKFSSVLLIGAFSL